jgi:hypothetical protein
MEHDIPKVGDRVAADGKIGPFTVVKVDKRKATADLQLALMPNVPLPNGADKGYREKNIPFAHIHPLTDTE